MQIVQFELSHDNFYCPATGTCIFSDAGVNEHAPSVQAIWTLETMEEPVLNNEILSKQWQTYRTGLQDQEDLGSEELLSFLRKYDQPTWLCFELSSQGLPGSECWIVINMDYDPA